jgi:hypothetical protein
MKVVGLSLFAVLAVPSLAFARSQPASLGRAVKPEEAPCFKMEWSSMKHVSCALDGSTPPATRMFELPLVIEDNGKHIIRVFHNTPVGPRLSCRAVAMTKDRRVSEDLGLVESTTFNAWDQIVLHANVPIEGHIYVSCNVPRNGIINNVVFARE